MAQRETVEPRAIPPVGGAYAKYVLALLVLVYMANFIDRQIISILAEDIKRDLGLTDSELGFLYGTAFAIFYCLFGIPLGRLADNWSRVRLLSIGLAVWSAMTMVSGFSRNFVQLSAARIGVGIGEATASPSAFSMLSDWFPRERRATALAIYSGGLYLGGGVSLLIGALVVRGWDTHFHGNAPLGLHGWQAAFLAVGLPGLLLALWVSTLKEPPRGRADGLPEPAPVDDVWRRFGTDLSSVLPPLTIFHAASFGARALRTNVVAALATIAGAALLIRITGDIAQFTALGIGVYAVFSWAQSLKLRDPPTFKLIWGTPAFLFALCGFGSISFAGYAIGFWGAPYAIRTFHITRELAGLTMGGTGAAGGFLGIVIGGWLGDRAKLRNPGGRILVAMLATLLPGPCLIGMFTATSFWSYYFWYLIPASFGSIYVGIAAATSQDLVLPRMRGAATATYFIGTTMIGLGLGPWFAGAVSKVSGSLATGCMALLVAAPVTLVCLWQAYRRLPAAEATRVERAVAAGEVI